MIDHSLVTGFTMFIRRSFDMTCFGISTYHRHEPPLADEHDAVQFAAGTDTPPPVRPFRRSPLSAFTIRRFDLAGFDEPTRLHEHRMDPPVNLELFYGVDDDDSSITTFSTNDGNSNRDDDIDDDNDSVINADDDGEFVPPDATDGDEIDDEDDD